MNEQPIFSTSKNDISHKIKRDLVDRVYSQAFMGYAASLFCGIIVLAVLHNSKIDQGNTALIWFSFFLSVLILRVFFSLFYKFKYKSMKTHQWASLFTIGTILSGITWGIVGTPLVLPEADPISASIILIILSGVCAGAVPLFSPIKPASLGFVLTALIPLIVYFVLLNQLNYWLFDLALVVFLTYLIILTSKTYKIVYNSLYLQYENEQLLESLTTTKNKLLDLNKKLETAATHDPLTNVANRTLFEQEIKKSLKEAEINDLKFSLLYIDVDKFKQVNDTFGHSTGDKLLLIVIARIKKILRKHDVVARLGGDEFAIILDKTQDKDAVGDVAKRLCEAVAQPVHIDTHLAQVYASIGISMYPENGKTIDSLIKAADSSMYKVKKDGGNNFYFASHTETI